MHSIIQNKQINIDADEDEDMYNVSNYTDAQLFSILDINNPTDRELEAALHTHIRKYRSMPSSTASQQMENFFMDMYKRFFDVADDDDADDADTDELIQEGFETQPDPLHILPQPGNISVANLGNQISTPEPTQQLTTQLDYAKGTLNPLLKQTIKRIISIDSQYRPNKSALSTKFTFNLSEPLRDVVSLSLYSTQIPYAWYTINNNFGSNFFYFKGNSPGIDNGSHDYKVEIASGNYNIDSLLNEININIRGGLGGPDGKTQVSGLISQYTDVSFGETQVFYNSFTGKISIIADIKKVFNESNYYLQFPNWTSPETIIDDYGNITTERFNSLAGYMGFNEQSYYAMGLYSQYFSGNITSPSLINNKFILTLQNSTFTVVPYIGAKYSQATHTYDPIQISLLPSTTTNTQLINKTRPEIVQLLDVALKTNANFDMNYSNCEFVNLPNSTIEQSYIKIHCKLNPLNSPIVPNLKLAAIFPESTNDIFITDKSCFKLYNTYSAVNDSGNVSICEFNDLLAETSILQSNYPVDSGDQLMFRCIASGYTVSNNNYIVDITDNIVGYSLSDYIAQLNLDLANHLPAELVGPSKSNIYLATDDYVYFATYLRTNFTTEQYAIRGTGKFASSINGFRLPSEYTGLNIENVFKSYYRPKATISFSTSDAIYITPFDPESKRYGNYDANEFVISMDNRVFGSVSAAQIYLQTKIAGFFIYDSVGRAIYPLTNSTVVYDATYGFIITINVNLELTEHDYVIEFIGNNWTHNLGWQTGIQYPIPLNSILKNPVAKTDNQITVYDNSNNYFDIIPFPTVNGLQTSNNQYTVRITIPSGDYSMGKLVDTINNAFNANPISVGSECSIVKTNDNFSYINMRLNVNKLFNTSDYRLVFYDPVSFVGCSKTVQNAKWDSTLGWILGYHANFIYELSNYVNTSYPSTSISIPALNYYYSDFPNQCVLVGDSMARLQLYNYFLILLDDYVQNHLNDGLVSITPSDNIVAPPPYILVCDPITGQRVARPADYGSPGVVYTAKQLYAFNQQVVSYKSTIRNFSDGPYAQDIFGFIPYKPPSNVSEMYTEFGGTLQNQQRLYFGPVNIHRMSIELQTDRGDTLDLNGHEWTFSLICEQLYSAPS